MTEQLLERLEKFMKQVIIQESTNGRAVIDSRHDGMILLDPNNGYKPICSVNYFLNKE